MSGHLDAVYCGSTGAQGAACQPALRAPAGEPAVE